MLGNLSPRVKKRFPSLNHYVEAGLLNDNERDIIEDLNMKFPKHSKHWLPIVWAASIITRARKEGRIRDDFAVKTIIDELNKFRGQCGVLIAYDTISKELPTNFKYLLIINQVNIRRYSTRLHSSRNNSCLLLLFGCIIWSAMDRRKGRSEWLQESI